MERASSDRQVSIERIDCPATRKIEEQRPSFSSCVLFPSFSLGTSSSSYFFLVPFHLSLPIRANI
jgi:hypothetical protein